MLRGDERQGPLLLHLKGARSGAAWVAAWQPGERGSACFRCNQGCTRSAGLPFFQGRPRRWVCRGGV